MAPFQERFSLKKVVRLRVPDEIGKVRDVRIARFPSVRSERVRRHIRWSQSTEIVCRADLDSFLIGAKTHRMVHRKMEDARRIPDEATGMNASDCSVGSNLNGSGISRQTFVSLTAEGPDGICFDAHCADDSSADTTESN